MLADLPVPLEETLHPPCQFLLLGLLSSDFIGWGNEGRGELFIESKEVFDALAVVLERRRAVAEVNGAI
jgi:hypothetical protein